MWIFISVISYFINAGVYVSDKFLLSKKFHSSIAYAFYVGIWSIFNFTLLIFDPWVPSVGELILDLLAGALFFAAMVVWYKALHQSEATRVVPVVGALTPIFSFILSFLFLGEDLSERQFLAFLILIIGGILISVKETRFNNIKKVYYRVKYLIGKFTGEMHAQYRPMRRLLTNSIISAFCFASYYVLMKFIYNIEPFVGGFVWSRLGTFICVLIILLIPEWRQMIVNQQKGKRTPKNLFFFLTIRFMAAMAFIMLNWAISRGNVAVINSLQGTQYIFLFL